MTILPQGPKVWFPNIIFTMVRSGKERSANEVVFRVPRFLNKLDIKQYLEGLYQVQVLNVRTANFLGKTTRQGHRHIPNRKNAIVTITEPFKFPSLPDPSLVIRNPALEGNRYPKIH